MAIANFLPDPNAAKMALHLGYFHAGFPGLLISGICFLLPATIMSFVLTIFYIIGTFLPSFFIEFFTAKFFQKIIHIPTVKYFLDGISASAVSLIAFAIYNLINSKLINLEAILITLRTIFLL